jgi:phenylalanyl-tRNA synthetase beta chain
MEPECDLLEEVLRIGGLDAIAPVSLPVAEAIPRATITARQARTAVARRVLASRGLAECVSYSFVAQAEAAAFGETPPELALKNPIAADLDQMRPTPLAGLAPAARRNLARGSGAALLFEIGPGFGRGGETLFAAGLRAGELPRHWQALPDQADAMAAKADLFALLSALSVPLDSLSVVAEAPAHYHPGRSGAVRQGPKTTLGWFGELHPALRERFGLGRRASAFELRLDEIADPKRRRRAPPDLPPFQPVARDFAFIVAESVTSATILRAARSADRVLISRVGIFDTYAGNTIPAGQKSVGVEVVFQPRTHTLSDQEIEAACTAVVEAVAKATGAHLR